MASTPSRDIRRRTRVNEGAGYAPRCPLFLASSEERTASFTARSRRGSRSYVEVGGPCGGEASACFLVSVSFLPEPWPDLTSTTTLPLRATHVLSSLNLHFRHLFKTFTRTKDSITEIFGKSKAVCTFSCDDVGDRGIRTCMGSHSMRFDDHAGEILYCLYSALDDPSLQFTKKAHNSGENGRRC